MKLKREEVKGRGEIGTRFKGVRDVGRGRETYRNLFDQPGVMPIESHVEEWPREMRAVPNRERGGPQNRCYSSCLYARPSSLYYPVTVQCRVGSSRIELGRERESFPKYFKVSTVLFFPPIPIIP